MRVAIVFDNFGPYHMARLSGAAKQMDVLGVEVAATSGEYDWAAPEVPHGLERVTLLRERSSRSDWPHLIAAYQQHVAPWAPDAIALPGWSSTAALAGARWASDRKIPAIVMSETNAIDFPRRSVTEHVKRRLVTLYRAGLCGGTMARSYLVELGLPAANVFLGYDVVDNDHFSRGAKNARETRAMPRDVYPSWRGRYFLASARFVPKKNLPRLIEAFAYYRAAAGSGAWPLVLLGDGAMREALERQRGALGLEASLFMPGFKQYDELPLYYGTAGVFVLPSTTEQWGLVVNEAMASGLPVLVSERCGSAIDLVDRGRNGCTFDPQDVQGLAKLMLDLAGDVHKRAAMGHASRDIIASWSPEAFGGGLQRATLAAIEKPPIQAGHFDKALLWVLAHQ